MMTRALPPFQHQHNNNASNKPLVCQVGGISETKKRVLAVSPHFVLKPLHVDHRGYREIAFYEALKQSNSSSLAASAEMMCNKCSLLDSIVNMVGDLVAQNCEQDIRRCFSQMKSEVELLRSLSTLCPIYYGVVGPCLEERIGNNHHIVLHDITASFNKPCVIDVKMGTQTYEPDATREKRCREYGKYPFQKEFGFRVVGMRVYDPWHAKSDFSGFRFFRKEFGRSLTSVDSLVEAFQCFFTTGTSKEGVSFRTRAISNLLIELERVDSWFQENKSFAFYSSSILMVYEGDESNNKADTTVALKMIDFGHVRREYGGDYGYKLGLRNLIKLFGLLLKRGNTKATRVNRNQSQFLLN